MHAFNQISKNIIEIPDVPYAARVDVDYSMPRHPAFRWATKAAWAVIPIPEGEYKILPKQRVRPTSRLLRVIKH